DGTKIRATTLCINNDDPAHPELGCRTSWPGGFSCRTAGASDTHHTCQDAEPIGVRQADGTFLVQISDTTINYDYQDFLPSDHGNEHWYSVRFESGHLGVPGTDLEGFIKFSAAAAAMEYRFDVFTDCSGSQTWTDGAGGTHNVCGEDDTTTTPLPV